MKTLILSLLAASGTLWGCSQKITASNLPSLVLSSLQAKFPGATALEWEKNGHEYEAEFTVAQVEYTALLDSAGHILTFKNDLVSSELPETVATVVKRDYPAYQIDDVEKVEKNGQTYFQLELENSNQEIKKVYAANGATADIPFWD